MKEMTVNEFNKCLRAGLGRCVLFLADCENREPYREAVLGACLNDYAYDGQSEGTRAVYTYRLLSYYNDDDYFYSRTADKLRNVLDGKGDNWQFEHLFDLVFQFARHGRNEAKDSVREIYSELLNRLAVKKREPNKVDHDLQWFDHICTRAVEVGDIKVFVKIAADIGGLLGKTAEYDGDDFDGFAFEADERFGKEAVAAALNGADDPDGNIAHYIQSAAQNIMPASPPTAAQKEKRTTARAERKNNRKCDVDKILLEIKRYDNTDVDGDWHSVALDIVNNEDTVFPIEAYMYVYTGSCARCRNSIVRAMHKHGLLTDELMRECACDCYDETREFAEKAAAQKRRVGNILQKPVHVIIDRKLGSVHPEHDDIIYEVNYGYAQGFIGGDGEEQDVYVLGVDEPIAEFDGIVTAIIHRKNDVEDKWVVVPDGVVLTDDEIRRKTWFMEKYFEIEIVR